MCHLCVEWAIMRIYLLTILLFLACAYGASGNRIVCYFINWSRYREGNGKFVPSDLDPSLCTHINYAFAVLDPTDLVLKSSDPWADIDLKSFEEVNGMKKKNPALKVLLSLGGWTDSEGDKYSRLVSSPTNRRNFISHVIPFLKKHNFDGLDLDWEYPNCWQGQCGRGPSDKTNFALFMGELRTAFDREFPGSLLTAAVAASGHTVEQSYDLPAMGRYLDFINVMTYDFHNHNRGKTGHHAQREKKPGDQSTDANVVDSMKQWVSGVQRNKLVIGLPAYGRSFRLLNPSNNGLGMPTNGPGEAGEFTREQGFLGFLEICTRLKNKEWTKGSDPKVGSWISRGDQWIGYDDISDTLAKAKFARSEGYGGVMVWDVSMDDFRGICCGTSFPFLKAMNNGLLGKGPDPSTYRCP